jgi:hypothetical protein
MNTVRKKAKVIDNNHNKESERTYPDKPTRPAKQRRPLEPSLNDIIIRDLDANIPVQPRGDQDRDDAEHVAESLPCVHGDTLECDGERELALVSVDDEAVGHVKRKDE